jgi:nucleoside-triphosphatase THEP1
MELFSGAFREAVVSVLDSESPVLATITIRRDPFTDAVRARRDVEILEIDPANRDRVGAEIAGRLLASPGPRG